MFEVWNEKESSEPLSLVNYVQNFTAQTLEKIIRAIKAIITRYSPTFINQYHSLVHKICPCLSNWYDVFEWKHGKTYCQVVSQQLHDECTVFVRIFTQCVKLRYGVIKSLEESKQVFNSLKNDGGLKQATLCRLSVLSQLYRGFIVVSKCVFNNRCTLRLTSPQKKKKKNH